MVDIKFNDRPDRLTRGYMATAYSVPDIINANRSSFILPCNVQFGSVFMYNEISLRNALMLAGPQRKSMVQAGMGLECSRVGQNRQTLYYYLRCR